MFQFPGFALKDLCIQSLSTCLCTLLTANADNNAHSGGLPHSEIRGSKPILGFPRLIAEYHVLHRLLLPRHPPNALFALDLIRKKQDSVTVALAGLGSGPCRRAADKLARHSSEPKVVHSRPGGACAAPGHLVSVLDLDNTCSFFRLAPESPAHSRNPSKVDCISLNDVKTSDWTAEGPDGRSAVKSGCLFRVVVSRLWWSRAGSNRRPLQCDCSALPAELRPRNRLVEPTGIEPVTS